MSVAIDRDLAAELLAEARLAPSAHNVQPSYVTLEGGRLVVHEDKTRTLPISDPEGRDIRLSHGCFIEGIALALSKRGLYLAGLDSPPNAGSGGPVAVLDVEKGGEPDPLAAFASARKTWRGAFRPEGKAERDALLAPLRGHPDLDLVTDPAAITRIAELADEASLNVMRDPGQRRELLEWMRLSRRHPDYHRDGLNAEAMGFGWMEAAGVPLALGSLFAPLDAMGLAARFTAERAITESATALALFHRPEGEDLLASGRAFYRAWLSMEALGLSGRPISVLTDWADAREQVERMVHLLPGRALVKVLRIGRPAGQSDTRHARLPVEAILRS